MEDLEGFVPGIRECNVCLELTNFYNQCTVSDMGRNYAAQVAVVKEMTGRNRAAQLEIVKQMSRQ